MILITEDTETRVTLDLIQLRALPGRRYLS